MRRTIIAVLIVLGAVFGTSGIVYADGPVGTNGLIWCWPRCK